MRGFFVCVSNSLCVWCSIVRCLSQIVNKQTKKAAGERSRIKNFINMLDKNKILVYYSTSTLVRRREMEFNSRIPIYLQVIDDIKKRLVTGGIEPGAKLPSTRELAVEYNINPNTAARIYREMRA